MPAAKNVKYVLKAFASCTALLQFCSASTKAVERALASRALVLLGNFIYRDTPQKWVARHCKNKMHHSEVGYCSAVVSGTLSPALEL